MISKIFHEGIKLAALPTLQVFLTSLVFTVPRIELVPFRTTVLLSETMVRDNLLSFKYFITALPLTSRKIDRIGRHFCDRKVYGSINVELVGSKDVACLSTSRNLMCFAFDLSLSLSVSLCKQVLSSFSDKISWRSRLNSWISLTNLEMKNLEHKISRI